MKEKDFQTLFNRWLKHSWSDGSAAFELKIVHGSSLPFDSVKPHQADALFLAKHHVLIHKIPDLGSLNPFDCYILKDADAYVVVMFYERGAKTFYMIDIDDWINETITSNRKSLTQERAKEIGIEYTLK